MLIYCDACGIISHGHVESGIISQGNVESGIISHGNAESGIISHGSAESGMISHRNAESRIISQGNAESEIMSNGNADFGIILRHAQLRMKCSLLSGHLYDLHVIDSPACQCLFDFEDNNHFFNCPLFGAERTELLTNLLTLGITNVNLPLLLIGCDDYDEELNKNIFRFVHHFIDSTGRL